MHYGQCLRQLDLIKITALITISFLSHEKGVGINKIQSFGLTWQRQKRQKSFPSPEKAVALKLIEYDKASACEQYQHSAIGVKCCSRNPVVGCKSRENGISQHSKLLACISFKRIHLAIAIGGRAAVFSEHHDAIGAPHNGFNVEIAVIARRWKCCLIGKLKVDALCLLSARRIIVRVGKNVYRQIVPVIIVVSGVVNVNVALWVGGNVFPVNILDIGNSYRSNDCSCSIKTIDLIRIAGIVVRPHSIGKANPKSGAFA